MLSEEDRAILDFERASLVEPGPKDMTIEIALGLSAARFYERLRVIVASGSTGSIWIRLGISRFSTCVLFALRSTLPASPLSMCRRIR